MTTAPKGMSILGGSEKVGSGQDNVGKFIVLRNSACPTCKEKPAVCIRYTVVPQLDDYVKDSPSFLLKSRTIGVTCGCYGKMQRQIVHINGGKK